MERGNQDIPVEKAEVEWYFQTVESAVDPIGYWVSHEQNYIPTQLSCSGYTNNPSHFCTHICIERLDLCLHLEELSAIQSQLESILILVTMTAY